MLMVTMLLKHLLNFGAVCVRVSAHTSFFTYFLSLSAAGL